MALSLRAIKVCMLAILGLISVHGVLQTVLVGLELYTIFPDKGPWPINLTLTHYVSVATDFLFILAGILGMVAILFKILCCLSWSAFTLLTTFALQLIHGISCIQAGRRPVTDLIFTVVRDYYAANQYRQWLEDYQWQHDCCGVHSYMDYAVFNQQTKLQDSSNKFSVPDSCCLKSSVPANGCGYDILNSSLSKSDASNSIYVNGCGPIMSKAIQERLTSTGTTTAILAFVTLILAVALLMFYTTASSRARLRRAQAARREPSSKNSSDGPVRIDTPVGGAHASVMAHRLTSNGPDQNRSNRKVQGKIVKKTARPSVGQKIKASLSKSLGPTHQKRSSIHKEIILKKQLEMLMDPINIETQSVNSTVPNFSRSQVSQVLLRNFNTPGTSKHPDINTTTFKKSGNNNGNEENGVTNLSHYISLPHFRQESHGQRYRASHIHNHVRRSNKKATSGGTGGGVVKASSKSPKYPSVVMVSNFPPIQEENESAGHSCPSTGTSGASTPKTSASDAQLQSGNAQLEMEQLLADLIATVDGADELQNTGVIHVSSLEVPQENNNGLEQGVLA